MHVISASTPCKEAIVIRPGEMAPDFRLQDDQGQTVQLSALRGKPVVLFFYPRDDTPGCTIECKEFRDTRDALIARAHVLGVSADDVASHQAFRKKYALNFPLLSDVDRSTCRAYGVWGATPWGEGIRRTTFIIDASGRVAHVFEDVQPQGHAAQVLSRLAS